MEYDINLLLLFHNKKRFYNKCWGVEKHLNIFVVKNKKNVEQISKSYYNKVTTP